MKLQNCQITPRIYACSELELRLVQFCGGEPFSKCINLYTPVFIIRLFIDANAKMAADYSSGYDYTRTALHTTDV